MTDKSVTLFRPVGRAELDLIENSDFRRFPPRLDFQPFFYPVLNREYAQQIARDWNTKDPNSGFAGFVTRFAVNKDFLDLFEPKCVGKKDLHDEYWIPSEQMEEFNDNIIGKIEVIDEYFGTSNER